ncbi:MAG: hypothetical protein PHS38_09550 [Bacteroidales bacterium]|nr:hypothetical protein [Bacteroidales bacterium]
MKRFLFRGDGNHEIGMGHIMRLFAIAARLKEKASISFCLLHSDERVFIFLRNNNLSYKVFKSEYSFIDYIEDNDVVIIDNYNYDNEKYHRIKRKNVRIVAILDTKLMKFPVDIIINHIPNWNLSEIEHFNYTKLFLGLDYCLIRPNFLRNQSPRMITHISDVVVGMGMSDSGFLLPNIIKILDEIDKIKRIYVVTGGINLHKNITYSSKVFFLDYINDNELIKLFDKVQLAIVPMSTLYMEALSRNTIVIGGYFVENQKVAYLNALSANLIYGIGDFNTLKKEKLISQINEIELHLPIVNNNRIGKGWNRLIKELELWIN